MSEPGHNSVAAARLRAFVERVEQPENRVNYALERFRECRGRSVRYTSRAFQLAANLLSTDYEAAKRIIRFADLGYPLRHLDLVGPLNEDCIGFVYYARRVGDFRQIKIGFTRDPDRREKQLTAIHKCPVRIFSIREGVMLDEHVEHCRNHQRRIVGEWFATELEAA